MAHSRSLSEETYRGKTKWPSYFVVIGPLVRKKTFEVRIAYLMDNKSLDKVDNLKPDGKCIIFVKLVYDKALIVRFVK